MPQGSNDLNMLIKAKVIKVLVELDIPNSLPVIKRQIKTITEKLENNPVKLRVELKATIKDLNAQMKLLREKLSSDSIKPIKIGVEINVNGSASKIKKQLLEIHNTVEDFNKKYGEQVKRMQELSDKAMVNGNKKAPSGAGIQDYLNVKQYVSTLKEAEALLKSTHGNGFFSSNELKDAEGNLHGFVASLEKANGVVQKVRYAWDEEKDSFLPINQQTVTNSEKAMKTALLSLRELDREILKLGKDGAKFQKESAELEKRFSHNTLTQEAVNAFKARINDEKALLATQKKENSELREQKKLIQDITKARRNVKDVSTRGEYTSLIKQAKKTDDADEYKNIKIELDKLIDSTNQKNKADKESQVITKKRLQMTRELRKIDASISPANRDLKKLISETAIMAKSIKSMEDFAEVQKRMDSIADDTWMIDFARKADDLEMRLRKNLQQIVRMGGLTQEEYQKHMEKLPEITKGNLGELERQYRLSQKKISEIQEQNALNRNFIDPQNTMNVDVKSLVDDRDTDALKQYFKALYGLEVETIGYNTVVDNTRGNIKKLEVGFKSTGKTVKSLGVELDNVSGKLVEVSNKEGYNANRNLGVFEQLRIAMARVPVWMTAMTAFYGTINSVRAMTREILEVDKALTELKRVADSHINIDVMFEGALDLSGKLGNNIHDVMQSINDLARTYGHFNERQLLAIANTSTLMSNVSDLTAQEATESLVGTMNAFNKTAEESITIVDALNEVKVYQLPFTVM